MTATPALVCPDCGRLVHWVRPGGPLPAFLAHIVPTPGHRPPMQPEPEPAAGHPIREALAEANPEAVVFDGCDAALVGYAAQQFQAPLAVYDWDALVQVFRDQGMDDDDALDWVAYNVEGLWAGQFTPLILHRPG